MRLGGRGQEELSRGGGQRYISCNLMCTICSSFPCSRLRRCLICSLHLPSSGTSFSPNLQTRSVTEARSPQTLTTPTSLQFPTFVDQLPRFKQLLKEPASFWVALIEKYFTKGYKIAVSWTQQWILEQNNLAMSQNPQL